MKFQNRVLNLSFVFLLFFGFFFLSCKQTKNSDKSELPQQSQMEQVMAIHDEVMPKMGKIGQLRSQIQTQIDSSTARGKEAQQIALELQDAYDSMMSWMSTFGGRFSTDEIMNGGELSVEKQEWLNEEEQKVKVVRDKINGSITKAEDFLKS